MLLDNQAIFSDAQAITANSASTNVIKMANTDGLKEVSYGTPMPLLVQVIEDFAGLTSVKVGIQTSASESFSSPTTLIETEAVPVASLKSGFKFPINFVPKGNLGYMRTYYTVVGTGTSGKITAGIVAGHDNSYQDM